jgi:hypothetical protein
MSTDLGENSLAAVPENKKTMRRNDIAIRKGTKSRTPILMEQFTQNLSRISHGFGRRQLQSFW